MVSVSEQYLSGSWGKSANQTGIHVHASGGSVITPCFVDYASLLSVAILVNPDDNARDHDDIGVKNRRQPNFHESPCRHTELGIDCDNKSSVGGSGDWLLGGFAHQYGFPSNDSFDSLHALYCEPGCFSEHVISQVEGVQLDCDSVTRHDSKISH